MIWALVKDGATELTGMSRDALHIYGGFFGWMILAFLTRRNLTRALPWLILLAILLINESYDLYHETWPSRDAQYFELARDVWNTMLLPTMVSLSCRFWPRLFTGEVPIVLEAVSETSAGPV